MKLLVLGISGTLAFGRLDTNGGRDNDVGGLNTNDDDRTGSSWDTTHDSGRDNYGSSGDHGSSGDWHSGADGSGGEMSSNDVDSQDHTYVDEWGMMNYTKIWMDKFGWPMDSAAYALPVCKTNGQSTNTPLDIIYNPYDATKANYVVGWIKPVDRCANCFATPVLTHDFEWNGDFFPGYKNICISAHFPVEPVEDPDYALFIMRDCLKTAYTADYELDWSEVEYNEDGEAQNENDNKYIHDSLENARNCNDTCRHLLSEKYPNFSENYGEGKYWDKFGSCMEACKGKPIPKPMPKPDKCFLHWSNFWNGAPESERPRSETTIKLAKCVYDKIMKMKQRERVVEFCEENFYRWCKMTDFRYQRCKRFYGRWKSDGTWEHDPSCTGEKGCDDNDWNDKTDPNPGTPTEPGQCNGKYNLDFHIDIHEAGLQPATGSDPSAGPAVPTECPTVSDFWSHEAAQEMKNKINQLQDQLLQGSNSGPPVTTDCNDKCARKGCNSGCEIIDDNAVCIITEVDRCKLLDNCSNNGVCIIKTSDTGEKAAECDCGKGWSGKFCDVKEDLVDPLLIAADAKELFRWFKQTVLKDVFRRIPNRDFAKVCFDIFMKPDEIPAGYLKKCGFYALANTKGAQRPYAVKFINAVNVLLVRNGFDALDTGALQISNDDIKTDFDDIGTINEIMTVS